MKKYFKFGIFERSFEIKVKLVKNLENFERFEEFVKIEEFVRIKFNKDLKNFEEFEEIFEKEVFEIKISRIKENITAFSSNLLLSSI